MPIHWRDKMSVGSKVLDADHKVLIRILNTFEEQTQAGADYAVLDATFRHLADYTRDHFAREEQIQKDIGYPFRDVHAEQHRALVARLLRAYKRLKDRRQAAEAAGVRQDHDCYADLLAILNGWLVEHILQEDMKLKPYILRYQEAGCAPA